MKYNTVIIGGGLAGLIAGASLSKFGKKVILLEQHYKPGGCATAFKRGDFVIEVGLHEMSGHDEGNSVQKVFHLLEVDKQLTFLKVPELYALYTNGKKLVFPHGFGEATKALVERYPEDEEGIRRFMKVITEIRKEALKLPRSPMMRKLLYPLMPLLYPNLVEATKHTVGSWLDKYIKSEQLKLELAAHVPYYADDPYTLSMFYFGLPQSSFIGGGGHFIQGGSQKLSDYLASYIEKNGGSVFLGKKAERIITHNGKATAVTFTDSFNTKLDPVTIECDNVVANCAIPLVPEMLDEPYASQLKAKIKDKTISCSFLCLYLGFKSDLTPFGVEHYSNEILGDDVKTLKDMNPRQQGDWSKRSFIFVDYSKIDSRLAPPDKTEGVICAVDYLSNWKGLSEEAYKAKKEEITEILLQRLDSQFPGIRQSIEYAELSTPKTIRDYTLNPEGTPYGFTQSVQQSGMQRFRNNFLIPNLYFASAWAFPGGGFEGTIMTGFLAAVQMNKDHIWSECSSDKITDERIVKLIEQVNRNNGEIELNFEKPKGFKYQQGQYAIVRLKEPEVMDLDLPYRWLSLTSPEEREDLKFKIPQENSSFNKSCARLKKGDEALVFGPIG